MKGKFIVANWKMNGGFAPLKEWTESFVNSSSSNLQIFENVNAVICPPALFLDETSGNILEFAIDKADQELLSHNKEGVDFNDEIANELVDKYRTLYVGAQNCSANQGGAFTGDVSASMLDEVGVEFVIIGHSERRKYHYETNQDISQKVDIVTQHKMVPILCIGESQEVRDSDKHIEFVTKQLTYSLPKNKVLDRVVIAYEPIWAIGTGVVPSLDDISQMCDVIYRLCRSELSDIVKNFHILYGGSVSVKNSKDILSIRNVDGLLIGKTSLNVDDFFAICKDANAA